jgi:thiol-disulfide isomerase/thioredoxin
MPAVPPMRRTVSHRLNVLSARKAFTQSSLMFSSHGSSSGRRSQRAVRVMAGGKGIEEMDAEQLEVAIQERDKPIIIDFNATWCGPCLLLSQELEKVCSKVDSLRSRVFWSQGSFIL